MRTPVRLSSPEAPTCWEEQNVQTGRAEGGRLSRPFVGLPAPTVHEPGVLLLQLLHDVHHRGQEGLVSRVTFGRDRELSSPNRGNSPIKPICPENGRQCPDPAAGAKTSAPHNCRHRGHRAFPRRNVNFYMKGRSRGCTRNVLLPLFHFPESACSLLTTYINKCNHVGL